MEKMKTLLLYVWACIGLGLDRLAYALGAVAYVSEPEFRKSVLDGVTELKDAQKEQGEEIETVKSEQQKLLENYDQLHTDTKAAFEDLTKAKNELNSMSEVVTSMRKVQTQLQREKRMAFGDPISRICADEGNRVRLNLIARHFCNRAADGKYDDAIQELTKALGEDSSPGSTMITDDLLREIYDTLPEYGAWATLARRNLGTKATKMPVKTARPVAYYVGEGAQIPDDTNKAGTTVSATVKKIGVLLNVSRELLEDSEFDVSADVLGDFMEAVAYRMDWAAFHADGTSTGTGAAVDGGFTGIFEGGTAAAAAAGNATVQDLTFEDVSKCLTTVDSAVLTRQARWWLHPFVLVRMLSIKDSNGRPIFLTATEAPAPGSVGSILGYPVSLVQAAPNANTAGSKVAVFGDPGAAVMGVRRDFEFSSSEHHRFDYDEISFKGVARHAFNIRKSSALSVLTTTAAAT